VVDRGLSEAGNPDPVTKIWGHFMFTVYVIQSHAGKLYVGYTCDINRRLKEHNAGLCKSTRGSTKWRPIYMEMYSNRGEALHREKWLKSVYGREFLKAVIADWNPQRKSNLSEL
jgi:putative endonuclease